MTQVAVAAGVCLVAVLGVQSFNNKTMRLIYLRLQYCKPCHLIMRFKRLAIMRQVKIH